MPPRVVFFCSLLLSACAMHASALKGIVLANEEGGSAVSKVKVSAGGANLTETGESGRFTLQFPNKQPGDTVQLSIAKPGYVVVNWFRLKVTLPKNADAEPVTLLICRDVEREEWASRFYRLKSWDAIDDTYRRRFKELEEANQQTVAAMATLRQQRDQAKAEAEKAAAEFARLKPDETTNLYAQAMSLFLNGKVDAALQVLDEKKLQRSLEEARRRKMEAEKAESQAVQTYLLRARLLNVQFRYVEAENVYRSAAEQAPDSAEAHFAYADFSASLNHLSQARVEYLRALELSDRHFDEDGVARAHQNLGTINWVEHETIKARQHFDEALKIYRSLAERNPELYLRYVAGIKLDLGQTDWLEDRGKEARQQFEDVLNVYQNPKWRLKFPIDIETFASALNSLGAIDRTEGRTAEARQNYDRALEIFQQLEPQNPPKYLSYQAGMLSNLGLLDIDQNRTEEACQALEKSLRIYRELYNLGAARFADDIARVQVLLLQLQHKEIAK